MTRLPPPTLSTSMSTNHTLLSGYCIRWNPGTLSCGGSHLLHRLVQEVLRGFLLLLLPSPVVYILMRVHQAGLRDDGKNTVAIPAYFVLLNDANDSTEMADHGLGTKSSTWWFVLPSSSCSPLIRLVLLYLDVLLLFLILFLPVSDPPPHVFQPTSLVSSPPSLVSHSPPVSHPPPPPPPITTSAPPSSRIYFCLFPSTPIHLRSLSLIQAKALVTLTTYLTGQGVV